jgi:hypothetical protein
VIAVSEVIALLVVAPVMASGWLAAARSLYRRWRPGGTAQLLYTTDGGRRGDYKTVWAPGFVVAFSMLIAIMWPVIIMKLAVTAKQPPTAAELEEKAREPERQLARRERELSIAERELKVATARMQLAVTASPEETEIARCEKEIVRSFGIAPAALAAASHQASGRGKQKREPQDPLARAARK